MTPEDVPEILGLNERNVVNLAPLDEARLKQLCDWAARVEVVDVDGAFAGFVITFEVDSAYDSVNFRWFSDRYDDFAYLDRIVLHEDFRRRRLGSFAYDAVEHAARPHGRLTLEVNLVPRNDPSLAFHAGRGYTEIGRIGDDEHLVSLMEKPL
jgi:predicted GNAT superfamily acetyltransferase